MFTLSPSDALTAIHALGIAAAEHSRLATGPDDSHTRYAERFRAVKAGLQAQFDSAFPLVTR